MANVGTLTLRVVADTDQAERDVERFEQKQKRTMDRLAQHETLRQRRMEELQTRRRTARAETVAAVSGGALLGGRIYAQQKGLIQQRTIGELIKRGLAFGLARALPAVGVALGSLTIGRFLFGRRAGRGATGSAREESVQQLQGIQSELVTLVSLTRDQNKTMSQVLLEQQRQRDPLGRDLAFQRSYLESLGLGFDARLTSQALTDALSATLLQDLQRAREREALRSPFQDVRNQMRGLMNDLRVFVSSARLGFQRGSNMTLSNIFNEIGTAPFRPFMPRTVGGSFTDRYQSSLARTDPAVQNNALQNLMLDLMDRTMGRGFFDRTRAPARAFGPNLANQADAIRDRTTNLINARTALGIIGPGNILNAPPTITAGSDAEHAFRVRQQRQEMQISQEIQWRQQMLALTQELVKQGVPGAAEDAVQQQIRNDPRTYLNRVSGVD